MHHDPRATTPQQLAWQQCRAQPGVQRVTLLSPTADIVIGQGEVARCTAKTVTLSDKTDV